MAQLAPRNNHLLGTLLQVSGHPVDRYLKPLLGDNCTVLGTNWQEAMDWLGEKDSEINNLASGSCYPVGWHPSSRNWEPLALGISTDRPVHGYPKGH